MSLIKETRTSSPMLNALVFFAHGIGILVCVLQASSSIIKKNLAILISFSALFVAIVLLFSFKGLITY